jgi:hypothetical protein
MRTLLLLAFALFLVAIVYLALRGGQGESRDVEPASPTEEPSIDSQRADPSELDTEERVAIEEPPTPPRTVPGDTEAAEDLIVVRALTPGGAPLDGVLNSEQQVRSEDGFRGHVRLSVLLSHQPLPAGQPIPEIWDWFGNPSFVETDVRSRDGHGEGVVAVLSSFTGAPSLYVSLIANRHVLAVRYVPRDVGEVCFILSAEEVLSGQGSFLVRFVDGDGYPVEGALLDPLPFAPRHEKARSDFEGRVEVGLLGPEIYQYEVVREDMATALLQFELGLGEARDLGEIVLSEPVEIAGQLRGPEPEVLGRQVLFRKLGTSGEPPGAALGRKVVTDSEGRFLLADLEPGIYALRVASKWRELSGNRGDDKGTYYSPYVRVDATQGSVRDVDIQLEPGNSVSLRLNFPHEGPVELLIRDAAGVTIFHETFRSNVSGTSCILPSGSYQLVARFDDQTEEVEFEAIPDAKVIIGR